MLRRVKQFSDIHLLRIGAGFLGSLLVFPTKFYAHYEKTLHYRPRSSLQPQPVREASEIVWPALRWLTIDELRVTPLFEAETWVVIRSRADQWLVGGVEALRDWQVSHPEAKVITFDEQRVDEESGAIEPGLKPQWNLDLFLSCGYVGHGVAIRGDVFTECLAGISLNCFDSVDQLADALLLAVVADNSRDCLKWVTHCPALALQVTTSSMDEAFRERWFISRQQQLSKQLDGNSTPCTVERGRLPLSWRVRWHLPEPSPLVSLCIPTRNGLSVLKPCLDAILQRTKYPNFEVLIVDNQSDCSATLDYLAELQKRDTRVRVLRYNAPFNFSAINNFAVAHARGQVIGLINNDVEPRQPGWLDEMVAQAMRPDIGCVGAKLFYPDGSIQHAGVVLGIGGVAGHAFRFEPGSAEGYQGRLQLVQNYSAVTAACLLVRKSVYLDAGGLDEHLAVNYNDVDFCLKVQALGYRNLWTPYAELIHHESATRGGNQSRRQRRQAAKEFQLMRRRWGQLLDADPAYHPALTRVHEDFSLASEPERGLV
ncbi:glycosyltransferase family 2 protein [Marinobacter metalliresistant]|uniref:Glycosyltransferase family 2 protein n=1 Tax=Marinobacter metalliresistant TaxID=2961995 RepID=A0ABZ2W4Q1_9GAMM